jgi:hypothetical protein
MRKLDVNLTLWTDDELLSRRRLGQTKLTVKPGQVGTSNATKPENLGLFEYAHLRAPLPKDLKGSEIFTSHQNQPHPETYFLMVREMRQRLESGLIMIYRDEARMAVSALLACSRSLFHGRSTLKKRRSEST